MDNNKTEPLTNLSRRNLLIGAAAVSATVATNALAGEQHHHHQVNKNTGLIATAMDCIQTGDACLAHCFELVKGKDTSMADCMNMVADMLPMCTALSKLASTQSTHLGDLAKLCIAICDDCEKECRKHADKHVECKECANACTDFIRECKKIAA
jgi:Cys-rich four helix bundle protein (predicted Tat secretion target)